jgi:hypothetical protein
MLERAKEVTRNDPWTYVEYARFQATNTNPQSATQVVA